MFWKYTFNGWYNEANNNSHAMANTARGNVYNFDENGVELDAAQVSYLTPSLVAMVVMVVCSVLAIMAVQPVASLALVVVVCCAAYLGSIVVQIGIITKMGNPDKLPAGTRADLVWETPIKEAISKNKKETFWSALASSVCFVLVNLSVAFFSAAPIVASSIILAFLLLWLGTSLREGNILHRLSGDLEIPEPKVRKKKQSLAEWAWERRQKSIVTDANK